MGEILPEYEKNNRSSKKDGVNYSFSFPLTNQWPPHAWNLIWVTSTHNKVFPSVEAKWKRSAWTWTGIQLKESGIPLRIGIQNPSSSDKDWNPIPEIRNARRGIQNPRLSWTPFPLHKVIYISCVNRKSDVKVQPLYPMKQKVSFQSILYFWKGNEGNLTKIQIPTKDCNSYRQSAGKKFLRAKNSPPHITFLMVCS